LYVSPVHFTTKHAESSRPESHLFYKISLAMKDFTLISFRESIMTREKRHGKMMMSTRELEQMCCLLTPCRWWASTKKFLRLPCFWNPLSSFQFSRVLSRHLHLYFTSLLIPAVSSCTTNEGQRLTNTNERQHGCEQHESHEILVFSKTRILSHEQEVSSKGEHWVSGWTTWGWECKQQPPVFTDGKWRLCLKKEFLVNPRFYGNYQSLDFVLFSILSVEAHLV
jgi:hypothetical protein